MKYLIRTNVLLLYIIFLGCTTIEGFDELAKVGTRCFKNGRLEFLIEKRLLNDNIVVKDVEKLFCLDLNLGRNYDELIIFCLSIFFENNMHDELFSMILDKFLKKLSSEIDDPKTKEQYEVIHEFKFKTDKVLDECAQSRIANVFKFFVIRVGRFDMKYLICFNDFDLILEKKDLFLQKEDKMLNIFTTEESASVKPKICILDLTFGSKEFSERDGKNLCSYILLDKGDQIPLEIKNHIRFKDLVTYYFRKFKTYIETAFITAEEIFGNEKNDFFCDEISNIARREDVLEFWKKTNF